MKICNLDKELSELPEKPTEDQLMKIWKALVKSDTVIAFGEVWNEGGTHSGAHSETDESDK